MSKVWNFKIDLTDENVFSEIEKQRMISFPEDLKNLIMKYNAASPSEYLFMAGVSERIFGGMLSFNKNEENIDSVFSVLNIVEDKNYIPFAVDPFGNLICYDIKNKEVAFWDHETDEFTSTHKDLDSFIDSLY